LTTTYTVVGTSLGCSNSANVLVTVNPVPVVNASGTPFNVCVGNFTSLSATGASTYLWSNGQSGTPINVSPLVTTTYTVTGTSVNGCTGTSSVIIVVNPKVDLVVGDDQTICEGSGVFLSASGAYNYSWSPMTGLSNANIANPFCSTDTTMFYTVIGTKGLCSDTAIAMIAVVANPSVVDSITWYNTITETLFLGGDFPGKISFIKKVGSITEYLPFSGDENGATFSGIILTNEDGIYIETNNGCSVIFPFHSSTGIAEEIANKIKFGPNPFSNVLNVKIQSGEYKVSLFNMSGQVVRNMSVNGNFQISRDGLPVGIYFLRILSSEEKLIYSTKVEVQ
jgi:hypothetical protein